MGTIAFLPGRARRVPDGSDKQNRVHLVVDQGGEAVFLIDRFGLAADSLHFNAEIRGPKLDDNGTFVRGIKATRMPGQRLLSTV